LKEKNTVTKKLEEASSSLKDNHLNLIFVDRMI